MGSHFALGLGILSSILEALILFRALRGKFASRFPFFYSYVGYIFLGSAILFYVVRNVWPRSYSDAFWFYFLISLLAEFAVLIEISDHIFKPYRALRDLGRMLTIGVSLLFFGLFILPGFQGSAGSGLLITELVKRSSLTKAVIIVGLLAGARYFHVTMTRNVSGMMAGFGVYLATNVVNFELLASLGSARYSRIFSVVGPLSYSLALLVWTIALWRYEPAVPPLRRMQTEEVAASEPLAGQLARLDTSLSRLLRK
jgi:hypothetical protein